jgi:membrane dipeptidase
VSELIVDAHLDLAWNALAEGRPFEGPPQPGYLISRAALAEAGVGLVFATIFCAPAGLPRLTGGFAYRTAREANLMARAQLGWYQSSGLTVVHDRPGLERYLQGWHPGSLAVVLLMEGADPIEKPGDVSWWAAQGVRIVGPSWRRTRYAGGTGQPGGLSNEGVKLLSSMAHAGVILDLSHMADQAVSEALEGWNGPVMASHSNARALVPGDRQLPDETVAELGRRGGVVGVSFYRAHLRGDAHPAGLADVVRHIEHLAEAAGGPEHVGLGTDLDGGFGVKEAPIAKLERIGELRGLLKRRFSDSQTEGIMAGNWLGFLRRSIAAPNPWLDKEDL